MRRWARVQARRVGGEARGSENGEPERAHSLYAKRDFFAGEKDFPLADTRALVAALPSHPWVVCFVLSFFYSSSRGARKIVTLNEERTETPLPADERRGSRSSASET